MSTSPEQPQATEPSDPGPGRTGAPDPDCLFCGIVAGRVPADLVAGTDTVVAFRDINPQAPLHVLVVPRAHHRDVAALAAAAPEVLADVVTTGARVAAEAAGTAGPDFRLVFNTGTSAGQTVFHAHGHVLAAPGEGLAEDDL